MRKLVVGLMVAGVFLFATNAFAAVGIDANTVLMLHSNGNDGSANFVDGSFINHSVTAYGNAQIDTAQSKFGGASGLFDGSGDYLSLADNDDWNFGSGDFTIDSWVRFNSVSSQQTLVCQTDGNTFWALEYETTKDVLFRATNIGGIGYLLFYHANWSPQVNAWYHIAVVRNGSTDTADSWGLFINGADQPLIKDAGNWNTALVDIAGGIKIGDLHNNYYLNGWMDELRISKGIARWTSDFTPPTSEYEVASEKVIPEPATLSLLGLGLLGLVFRRKKTS